MHSQTYKMDPNYEALAFVNNSFSPGEYAKEGAKPSW